MENSVKADDLIEQFIDGSIIKAMHELLKTSDIKNVTDSAIEVAKAFNADDSFKAVLQGDKLAEQKLLNSFHKNLQLLVQKTWVEQSDVELKDQVLFCLEQLCKDFTARPYTESYDPFFAMLNDAVYLMFGIQTQNPEFSEYALRIDPEFGIFWWYRNSLPPKVEWDNDKCRITLLLGMYFLANY